MDTVRKNATAVLPLGGDIKKHGMSRRFDSAIFHENHDGCVHRNHQRQRGVTIDWQVGGRRETTRLKTRGYRKSASDRPANSTCIERPSRDGGNDFAHRSEEDGKWQQRRKTREPARKLDG